MPNRIQATLMVLVIASLALPALAGEGRTPIYQYPTVITQPGKYIVTRDIVGGGPLPVIDVKASPVDIDLNGFTLSNVGSPQPVIYTFGGLPLTIRNGTILGGIVGIDVMSGADDLPMFKVVIEDVNVLNSDAYGIRLTWVSDFALRRNNVAFTGNVGIYIDGSSTAPWTVMGTIEDNRITNCAGGITVVDGTSVGILNNRLEQIQNIAPPPAMGAIVYDYGESALISGNTVDGLLGDGGGIYLGDASGCKIYNNVVRRAGSEGGAVGIWIAGFSDDNLVLNNVVTQSFTDGIWIEGSRNHVDRNVMNNNGTSGQAHGLHFSNAWLGADNTLGRNTARGNPGGPCTAPPGPQNTTDYCDEGFNNSSFGDNFLPTPY